MRLSVLSSSLVFVAFASLPLLVGCSDDEGSSTTSSPTPQGTTSTPAPTDPGVKETPAAASCDAAPSIAGTKTLSTLSSAEKGQLCDYAACGFGGYGKSKTCGDGTSVSAEDNQAACLGDATWTKCGSLKVSDFVACQAKLNADPCASLQTILSDAACAPVKACATSK